jgi:asparagine synthase (glutamine-hydrolysing)
MLTAEHHEPQTRMRERRPGGWWLATWSPDGWPGLSASEAPVYRAGASLAPSPGHPTCLHIAGEAGYALPSHAVRGDRAALFDGALYEPDDLRSQLGLPLAGAAGFPTDAELLLHAYERWGEDCLRRIKGIYALLIWDGGRGRLLAARDPLGVYPLFHADAGPAVLFSTHPPALLNHPRVSRALNRMVLADHLCDHWRDMEGTYFESVRRVPPACAVCFDRHGRSLIRHWDPVPVGEPVRWVEENELGQFDALLEQAVNRSLHFGPAAVFLSGGLDSVSVAGVAADSCRRQGLPIPQALSLVFPDPRCNEEDVQKGVAAGLGMPQVLLSMADALGGRRLLGASLELSAAMPAPLYNLWLPAYLSLAEHGTRAGCRAILTGSGGDEWLTVGPSLAADLLRTLDFAGFRLLHGSAARSYHLSSLALLYELFWTFGLRLWLGEWAGERVRHWAPRGLRARRHRLIRREIPSWVLPDPALRRAFVHRAERGIARPEPGSFYLREARGNLRRPLNALEMEENFATGRLLGVRLLHPYWDADLVEFLLRTPPRFILDGGRTKALVRQALARRFPDLGFAAQRKVLAERYFGLIMAKEGEAALARLDGFKSLADMGLVEHAALRRAFAEAAAQRARLTFGRIWSAMSLASWVQSHQ